MNVPLTPSTKTISVVVPVFSNQQSLPLLFEELQQVEMRLAELSLRLELIFVDDGSEDDSFTEMLQIRYRRPETKIVKLTRNFGEHLASKSGLHFVTGDCFAVLAADLQDPPDLLVESAARWLAGSRFVICERKSREDSSASKAFSALYYKLLRMMVVPDYPKGGYDLALMDRAFLPYLVNSSKHAPIPLLAYSLGFVPDVIKYHRKRRAHGRSGWTFRKRLNAFLDVMLGFSVTPIRLVSGIGVSVAALSFVFGLLTILDTLVHGASAPGWASIVSLVSFLLGVVITMLGIIGEYLWRILDEVNKRPEVVIDQFLDGSSPTKPTRRTDGPSQPGAPTRAS
jgi:polyisoprenyl-phosphate glycosyltransferase